MKSINIRQAIDSIKYLEEKQLMPASIERIKNLLKSIFNIAIKRKIMDYNPLNNVTVSKSSKRK